MAKIPPGIPHARLTERCIMTTTNARRATVSESIIINLAPVAPHCEQCSKLPQRRETPFPSRRIILPQK